MKNTRVFYRARISFGFIFASTCFFLGASEGYQLLIGPGDGTTQHSRSSQLLLQDNSLTFSLTILTDTGQLVNASTVAPPTGISSWTAVVPSAVLSNRSWHETVEVPSLLNDIENLLWEIAVPRHSITTDLETWWPKEQWILSASIEVAGEKLTDSVPVLDTGTEPVLQWSLGDAILAPVTMGTEVWVSSSSPCGQSVLLTATNINENVVFGVTHQSFHDNSATWYENPQLCSVTGDCSSNLLSVVLTNHHILLLTTESLLVSDNLLLPPDYLTDTKPNLNFTVHTISSLYPGQTCSSFTEARLSYTKHCQFRQHDRSTDDIIILIGSCSNGDSLAVYSSDSTGFSSWTKHTTHSGTLLDIAFNIHMEAMSLLVTSQDETWVETRELTVTSALDNKLLFSKFTFPGSLGCIVTGLAYCPVSHLLYAYGTQVWQSTDGGNHFVPVYQKSGSVLAATHITFSDTGHHIICRTNVPSLLYSSTGVSRFIELPLPTSQIASDILLQINNEGTLQSFGLTAGNQLVLEETTVDSLLLDYSWTESRSFVPCYLTENVVLLYESVIPPLSGDMSAYQSVFHQHHIGQVISFSSGGSGLITSIDQPTENVEFLACLTVHTLEPLVWTDSQLPEDYGLSVEPQNDGSQIVLHLISDTTISSGWTADHVGMTVVLPFVNSYLVTAVEDATYARAITPILSGQSFTADTGQWFIYNMRSQSGDEQWHIIEDECRHQFSSDSRLGSHLLFEMDILDQLTLSTTVKISDPLVVTDYSRLYTSLSNPFLVQAKHWKRVCLMTGQQNNSVILTKPNTKQGLTVVRMISPLASLRCPQAAALYTIYLGCPCLKRLIYIKPVHLTMEEYLHGNPIYEDSPLLYELPPNYRPPSKLGVGIPTSPHIYNADPNVPITSRFKISQNSGQYKQCAGKTSKTECGCTPEMMYSDDVAVSDCKQRVYRVHHPGTVYPEFYIEQPGRANVTLNRDYIVHLQEINDRVPSIISKTDSDLMKSVKALDSFAEGITAEWFTPTEVKIFMVRSGLHHFRADIPSGYSFCNLYAEFQVFVDNTPIPYPVQYILRFTVALLIGGVLFGVYLWYLSLHHTHRIRPVGPQCLGLPDMVRVKGKYPPNQYIQEMAPPSKKNQKS